MRRPTRPRGDRAPLCVTHCVTKKVSDGRLPVVETNPSLVRLTIAAMFTRTHCIGRYVYTEALESYRDPETGKSRHRCVVRWRAERSFAEELGRIHFEIDRANKDIAYYQGIIDRTERPRFRKHIKEAPKWLEHLRRNLQRQLSHFTALIEARNKGLPADDGVIERAAQSHARRWAWLSSRAAAIRSGTASGGLRQRQRD
jgi:hypothetical protein